MNPEDWAFFHDGMVSSIDGNIPGNLIIGIEIEYLRAIFPGDGIEFRVHLTGCHLIELTKFDGEVKRSFSDILAEDFEILSIQSVEPLILDCTNGALSLKYESASITLDTGQPITGQALADASGKYWTEWQQAAEKARSGNPTD